MVDLHNLVQIVKKLDYDIFQNADLVSKRWAVPAKPFALLVPSTLAGKAARNSHTFEELQRPSADLVKSFRHLSVSISAKVASSV